MFAYCNNNPVNGYDPEGTFDETDALDPRSKIRDNARAFGSAALAVGLLVANYYLHKATAIYGRDLLARLANIASSSTPASASSSSPASPPDPENNRNKKGKDYVEAKSNKMANKWAKEAGAEDAETLKEYYAGKQGSRFNIVRDRETGQLILKSLRDGIEIPTDYYLLR